MLFGEILRVALGALVTNKLRSLLTMLGIVIGVGSVITMVAIGKGAQNAVTDRIAALGTTLIMINAGMAQRGGVATADIKPLTLADAREIEDRAKYVSVIQPQQDVRMQVPYGNKNISVQVTGTTANFLESQTVTRRGRLDDPRSVTGEGIADHTPYLRLVVDDENRALGHFARSKVQGQRSEGRLFGPLTSDLIIPPSSAMPPPSARGSSDCRG